MNVVHFRAYDLRDKIDRGLTRKHERFHGILAQTLITKKGAYRKKTMKLIEMRDSLLRKTTNVDRTLQPAYERVKNN